MSKVTMTAIAREAGVGVATVDRVLNRRAPVRSVTEQKVLTAASRLGYRLEQSRILSSSQPVIAAQLRMGFILLSSRYSFYQPLGEALRKQAEPYQPSGSETEFCWHDINDVEAVASSLRSLAKRVEVIGVVALDHPLIRHAIQDVSRQGVRVYALFSDFSPCGHAGFIGLDNQKAGRTAAWMAQHLLHKLGSIGVLLGDHRFTCQESCEISFRSYLREAGISQRVLEPLKTHESIDGGYQATQQLLNDYDDLVMIYAPCGGIEGVVRALRQSGRKGIALLCHGPIQGGELALIDGTITLMLRHRIEEMAAAVVEHCISQHSGENVQFFRVTLPFEMMIRENV
ncbi:MAG: LacI family DNA-binding transcriptional regulator [Enterobacterales bacterium endosymbiont of Blomia tropicalis]|uniref:LacI family DNA-binding transcriptional regulator n=1 Tax=Mixta mediterraneensis TaxID=2758443 RepID=UPI0025A78843|nr:LacI family DNA-binding transcriptional regulator [Mixta mediterraneensis]MDL4912667.1 LacI family DNA-binding transcriptional regulator [Mixta mediterraneensis]